MQKYRTFIDNGKLKFVVGYRQFTIEYPGDDIDELRWMRIALENALSVIAGTSDE